MEAAAAKSKAEESEKAAAFEAARYLSLAETIREHNTVNVTFKNFRERILATTFSRVRGVMDEKPKFINFLRLMFWKVTLQSFLDSTNAVIRETINVDQINVKRKFAGKSPPEPPL